MNLDNECCCGCNTTATDMPKVNKCPICNSEGISVGKVTVEHLVAENHRKNVAGDQYKICMNEDCDVVYYNLDNGTTFLKDQVNVPIWFKKDANPKYACYCSKVTEEQVIEAVVKHGARTVKEVNAITGAMKNSNCKENNPLGVCCHKIIQEAIDKASAESIGDFVRKFKDKHSSLNILFNNAAVMKAQRTVTKDGFETMFQTNYLAPVMLTTALTDLLMNSTPARIINIAVPPEKLRIDFDDLQASNKFKSFNVFMMTKLYLPLYTLELSEKLADIGIIVNSINPGAFKSELGKEFPWLLRKISALLANPADKAAENVLFLASSDESPADSGKVFDIRKELPLTPYWKDINVRRQLWSNTELLLAGLATQRV